ncbi:hypothetical protein [Micromonospora sp. 067-2]|uniref:hypothetical protein n=1 Tax=Micromonospora sp. 067-2 TaxID=2789270 RepID=UPI00397A00DB
MNDGQEQGTVSVQLRGLSDWCGDCRVWRSRLVPYPCRQVQWATGWQVRSLAAWLLGGRR